MPRARNADPVTSHQAAAQVEASGRAKTQRDACLAAVRIYRGMTAAEIAQWLGLERHIPSRRLPELRAMGLVTSGQPRPCRVTGNRSMTWGAGGPLVQQELF